MTETNATVSPPPGLSFPPGRYGRRREPRPRRRALVMALAALVILTGTAMAYQLTRQYGEGRPYHPTVERFYDVTDEQVVVEFTVRVPAGETAVCVVRARAEHGGEVGREEIRIDPPGQTSRVRVVHRLATTERPTTGEVQRCWRLPEAFDRAPAR